MNKLQTFEDVELLVKQGISGVITSALVSEEVTQIVHSNDPIIQEARISIFANEGRTRSDHYVMECQSAFGNRYILCIGVGDGTPIINYTSDDMISFIEECEQYDIDILPSKPVLAYSYRGISLISEDKLTSD